PNLGCDCPHVSKAGSPGEEDVASRSPGSQCMPTGNVFFRSVFVNHGNSSHPARTGTQGVFERAVVCPIDAGMYQNGLFDAKRVDQLAVVSQRGRLGRVAACRSQRIALCILEDMEMAITSTWWWR